MRDPRLASPVSALIGPLGERSATQLTWCCCGIACPHIDAIRSIAQVVSSRKIVRYHGLDTEMPFRAPIGGQDALRSLRFAINRAAKTNQSSGPELGFPPFEPDSAHIGLARPRKFPAQFPANSLLAARPIMARPSRRAQNSSLIEQAAALPHEIPNNCREFPRRRLRSGLQCAPNSPKSG